MRALFFALWSVAALGAAPGADGGTDVPKAAPTLKPVKVLTAPRGLPDAGVSTSCRACHTTGSWKEAHFNHERTGFSLTGGHATTGCRGCHVGDFQAALPRSCSGCHTDVHAAELGARCEGCHDTSTWRSRFDAEAHRRTNFPLLGGHAALPCVECHTEARERRFSRAMVECGGCHAPEVQAKAGSWVDHALRAFDVARCRECHGSFRWTPARFPTHDACFPINSGAHAGLPCLTCHKSEGSPSPTGTCKTGSADCIACHEHTCSVTGSATPTDQLHAGVPGYQCASQRCYECHQLGGAP